MITYKEQYEKVIDAYFKDELNPMSVKYCVCGTLAGGSHWSRHLYRGHEHFYSLKEYLDIEEALLNHLIPFGVIKEAGYERGIWFGDVHENLEGYEDALFKGMSDALDVLKSIHEQRGEVIDEQPVFTKRELV